MTFRVKMLLVALGVARANVYIDRFLKSSQLKILGASKLATSFHRASFLTPENENTERALSPPRPCAILLRNLRGTHSSKILRADRDEG